MLVFAQQILDGCKEDNYMLRSFCNVFGVRVVDWTRKLLMGGEGAVVDVFDSPVQSSPSPALTYHIASQMAGSASDTELGLEEARYGTVQVRK